MFASLSLVTRASAFSSPKVFMPRRHFASTTSLGANVRKLSDPQKELLDNVDVFIFDCDGVIWRVSEHLFIKRSCLVNSRWNSVYSS